jgi:hypothetical protein
MKMRKREIIFLSIFITFVFVFMHSLLYSEPPIPTQPTLPINPKVTTPIQIKCPDLEASLTLTKTILNNKGIINISGKVCNVGNADYVSPPLPQAHYSLTTYDPTRPLTRENITYLDGKNITDLKKGNCININKSYEIPSVIEWGHRTPKYGECQAQREFSLSISRNVPDDVNFRANEDCKTSNNIAKKNVKYMTNCPW